MAYDSWRDKDGWDSWRRRGGSRRGRGGGGGGFGGGFGVINPNEYIFNTSKPSWGPAERFWRQSSQRYGQSGRNPNPIQNHLRWLMRKGFLSPKPPPPPPAPPPQVPGAPPGPQPESYGQYAPRMDPVQMGTDEDFTDDALEGFAQEVGSGGQMGSAVGGILGQMSGGGGRSASYNPNRSGGWNRNRGN